MQRERSGCRHLLCWVLAIASTLISGPSIAQATLAEGFLSLQLENDLWGSKNDRFYTHGTKLSYASPDEPPKHLSALANNLPWFKFGKTSIYGYEIGQAIFTPEDITTPDLIANDRPYAGYLFYTSGLASNYRDLGDREWINILGYSVGIVGPTSLAGETQSLVHEIVDSDDPKRWDNQVLTRQ